MKPAFQASASLPEQPERHAHVTTQSLELPAVCGVHDVARVLGVSASRVYQLQRLGRLRMLECQPSIGAIKYSGAKLAAWANGELERPRYFGAVRKRSA